MFPSSRHLWSPVLGCLILLPILKTLWGNLISQHLTSPQSRVWRKWGSQVQRGDGGFLPPRQLTCRAHVLATYYLQELMFILFLRQPRPGETITKMDWIFGDASKDLTLGLLSVPQILGHPTRWIRYLANPRLGSSDSIPGWVTCEQRSLAQFFETQ